MSIFRANWHILIALIFVIPQIQYGALPIKHQLNYQNKLLKCSTSVCQTIMFHNLYFHVSSRAKQKSG